eukprot:464250_1
MGKRHLLEVEVLVKGYYERVDKPEKNEHNLLTDLTCKVCNVSLQDQNAYDRHIVGKHLATIEGPGFEPIANVHAQTTFSNFQLRNAVGDIACDAASVWDAVVA